MLLVIFFWTPRPISQTYRSRTLSLNFEILVLKCLLLIMLYSAFELLLLVGVLIIWIQNFLSLNGAFIFCCNLGTINILFFYLLYFHFYQGNLDKLLVYHISFWIYNHKSDDKSVLSVTFVSMDTYKCTVFSIAWLQVLNWNDSLLRI